jgi:hypothetical protein
MNEWNIQSRARTCQSCGRAFADQEMYHTLLFEQRFGFERQDVCGACWEEQHRHGAADRKGFISHWQGTFLQPPPAPPDPIQRDSAESLLRRLTELNAAEWQPAAFILAVMLERKRILKIRDQVRQEGQRIFVYELGRTGELFTVPDPQLRLDQLEAVQRSVAQLLEHGLPEDSVGLHPPGAPAAGPEDNEVDPALAQAPP